MRRSDRRTPTEGAWVFVSHSHKDLEKVRRIRNALEAKGHNPLLFFLKCLDDDAELDDLIRREIEARTWFILCDSPNAKASKWVQEEVEIIKSLEGKVYEIVDLDGDIDLQVERVTALSKRATVFISCAYADEGVARTLQAALLEQDFRVFFDATGIRTGDDWRAQIAKAIDQAVQEGFFLLLLSPEALRSRDVRHELFYAFMKTSRDSIVPVIVRDSEATLNALPEEIEFTTMGMSHFFDLTVGELNEGITELINWLKHCEME